MALALVRIVKSQWRCRDLNPGPLTCEASALPLSYIPNVLTLELKVPMVFGYSISAYPKCIRNLVIFYASIRLCGSVA